MLRNRRGYTLVEVIIATLLLAMLTVPIMSLATTSKMASGRFERRHAAATAIRRVSESLKSYVTADRLAANGPAFNVQGGGPDGWALPGDLSNSPYALANGTHGLNPGIWAQELQAYSPSISYTVTNRTTPSGPMPDVSFTVEWREPQ